MILIEKYTGPEAQTRSSGQGMCDPCFDITEDSEYLLDKICVLEVWGSEFLEEDDRWPGQDFNEYRAFNKHGDLLFTKRKLGY